MATNGLKKQLDNWNQINWKKINKTVRNLRQRIFRARKLGNFRRLRNLQKLMQKSYANLLLSVRRITQTNQGKATAGIDKQIVNTPQARVILVNNWKGGNLKPTRRVEIPKPNGKKRPLGIPTVRVKNLNGAEQEVLINKLNPILRGFANYYRGGVSKKTFNYIASRIWQYLWRWAKRRHRNKSAKWIQKRYFRTIKGNRWTFACTIGNRRGKDKELVLYQIAHTPIERHIKVKGDASPDDPTLREYWEKRHQKHGKSRFEKSSKLYKIAANQKWICPVCGEPLFNGEEIDIHHIVPVAEGGTDEMENLQHLHKACHKQVHKTQVKSRLK